ncbi:unnamed protein product (macronuclear) [Paramecium tetraurelia]|uniref:Uncharacterized protein n=1 Tax=Paramecium tetraurelia TaxID=5888 RepID=A0DLI0_PARTE|nr:uncharacterized protein GSPATT00018214001 [Paramecium tetraurelia]CAK83897.1 unnamed protein product [Paramecium tetraurelia]|eukprot:XP_001451294.1 hypothetical protein (macronuclear) [Paramecium tetraurelia strain d4-2]
MGNQCCSQTSTTTQSSKEILNPIRQDSRIKSLGDSIQIGQFGDLIQQHCQLYQYQDGDGLLSPPPLSPKQQHVIVYLEPKVVIDEAIHFQTDVMKGILSTRSHECQSDSPCSPNNGKEKPQRRVQFKEQLIQ